jgi:hypothetical protein
MTNGTFTITCDSEYARAFMGNGFMLEAQLTNGLVTLTFAGDDVVSAVGRAVDAVLSGGNDSKLIGRQD